LQLKTKTVSMELLTTA